MEWILYIVIGIVVFAILSATGIIKEFFMMLGIVLMCVIFGAIIGWLTADAGGTGAGIGAWVGIGLYFISCIMRIIFPDDSTTLIFDEIGNKLSSSTTSNRADGIAGIVMLIILFIVWLFAVN